MSRNIKYLVCHCTATPHNTTIDSIKRYWKTALKWKAVGYHKIIKPDGTIVDLAPEESITNGVAGYNSVCLHLCYIGGKDVDDRTIGQRKAIAGVLLHWLKKYPNAKIIGHRDFPNVKKACPRFDAEKEYGYLYDVATQPTS